MHQLQIYRDGGGIHRQREGAAAHVTAGENGGGLGDVVIHSAGAPGDDPLLHHQLAVHQLVGEGEGGLAAELLRRPLLHLTQIVAGIVEQLPQRHRFGGVEGEGGHGIQPGEVYGDHGVVAGTLLRGQPGIGLRPSVDGQVFCHGIVRLPDGGQARRLRGHYVDADAVIHGQVGHAGTGKLQNFVFGEAVSIHGPAQGDGHVVGTHAVGRRAGEPHQHHLRGGDVIGVFQQLLHDLRAALAHAHGTQSAVTGVAVGAEDHAAAAGHHLPRILVDHRLIGGDVVSAVLHGGRQAEGVVVLVDGAAHGAETVVAVGENVRHRELPQAAGLGGLNDTHIGDVVGDETIEGQVKLALPRPTVVTAEDLIGHGLIPAAAGGGDRCGYAALQHDAAAVQLDHR